MKNTVVAAVAALLVANGNSLRVTRRVALPAVPAAALGSASLVSAKDRTDGYAVQKTGADWQRSLSGPEYFVLRNGGTEPPNSSPLVKEKRVGEFRCAGCGAPLFSSAAKFASTASTAQDSSRFFHFCGEMAGDSRGRGSFFCLPARPPGTFLICFDKNRTFSKIRLKSKYPKFL